MPEIGGYMPIIGTNSPEIRIEVALRDGRYRSAPGVDGGAVDHRRVLTGQKGDGIGDFVRFIQTVNRR